MSNMSLQMYKACAKGDNATVVKILDAGFNVNAKSLGRTGVSALLGAAVMGHDVLCKTLIRYGADVDLGSPLYCAAALNKPHVCCILMDAGANLHAVPVGGNTALHVATENCFAEVVELLLLSGANPHLPNSIGISSLDIANSPGNPLARIFENTRAAGKMASECLAKARHTVT